jgi:phytoene synthase
VNPLVARGYAEAREVTRHYARSFYFASALLFGARKRAAYALYAVCRGLDELVDGGFGADGGRLDEASYVVRRAMEGQGVPASQAAPWSAAQLAALSDAAARFSIPAAPFAELVKGMQMDLDGAQYATWGDLDLYCYRAAGTVGELMAPVLGCRDDRALESARDLGKAMQLTNILRDVREDYERGRVYLPSHELRFFGVSPDDLAQHRRHDGFRALMQHQVARARELYQRGNEGIGALGTVPARATVRVMSAVYGGILDEIVARDFDVFSSRVSVSTWGKTKRAIAALTRPDASRWAPSPARGEGGILP